MPGWLAAHFESMHVQLGKGGLPLSTDMRAAMSSSCSFALTAHLNGSPTFCVNCAATYAESRDALWNSVAEHMNEAIRKVISCMTSTL
ncbi:hypothetical protein FA95DRAFT_1562823 [Auriscalpium vulgare]|uniref:Uncharacterized protein n=1 Tax=Auriscalpium vulgare TaxID=40419 RepID=A0ACB8RI46_9AGAM|nr:hypothetical protein FA95DRAFT_1562823 [Auriscalpium vulgare]